MLARVRGDPPPPVAQQAVFLTDSVELETPVDDVAQELCRGSPELLPMVEGATATGEAVLVSLGLPTGEHFLGVPATVRVGPCLTRGGSAAIAVRWEAIVVGSVVAVLDGTFVVTALDRDRCRLEIEASYRPPLDRLGGLFDRAVVLRRVAESTVHEFLHELADAL